jgi:hypothetical protein
MVAKANRARGLELLDKLDGGNKIRESLDKE